MQLVAIVLQVEQGDWHVVQSVPLVYNPTVAQSVTHAIDVWLIR